MSRKYIDEEKIKKQIEGLKNVIAKTDMDFAHGELHALSLVLNGFYCKEEN